MNKLKRIMGRWGGVAVASVALLIGTASANAACIFWYHQPKVPQAMDKFKNPRMRG